MSDPFVPRVGGTLSAEIAVPDHEREVRFYARVLTTGEAPLWREDLMNSHGMPIIGLGERSEEHADLPVQWMPHIQVADVAASVQRAIDLGGHELMHGMDDAGTSQWAVLLDADGAAFGVVPVVPAEAMPSTEDASGAAATPGCIAWIDLTVPDASATSDFYRQVLGWRVHDVEPEAGIRSESDHEMLGGDGEPAAGIRRARDEDTGLPPVWVLHLPVGDLAESLRRVEAEGGTILGATEGADGEPKTAVIQDPVGVCLALVSG